MSFSCRQCDRFSCVCGVVARQEAACTRWYAARGNTVVPATPDFPTKAEATAYAAEHITGFYTVYGWGGVQS